MNPCRRFCPCKQRIPTGGRLEEMRPSRASYYVANECSLRERYLWRPHPLPCPNTRFILPEASIHPPRSLDSSSPKTRFILPEDSIHPPSSPNTRFILLPARILDKVVKSIIAFHAEQARHSWVINQVDNHLNSMRRKLRLWPDPREHHTQSRRQPFPFSMTTFLEYVAAILVPFDSLLNKQRAEQATRRSSVHCHGSY